ncbi:hypothetical protein ACF0H5_003217 [Mactra antiquata]
MPAFITPIEHTRASFLKPPDGLRFGNFEGVVHLPPPTSVGNKIVTQSFSSLNNQQIYKTICEWYDDWRPWQQKVLLCGIVDRCSIRQVDMLATTLEPIRHRDYTVAVRHHYPTSPLKKVLNIPTKRKKKKKTKIKKDTKKLQEEVQRSLNVDGTLAGAVTPESVYDSSQVLTLYDQSKLEKAIKEPLSTITQEKTKEFTNIENKFNDIDSYADSLAGRIIEESIPKTVELFDPSELYAQDLASSIVQQALDNVVTYMDKREDSIAEKTKHIRLDLPLKDEEDHAARHDKVKEIMVERETTQTSITDKTEKKVDMTVLNKYMKYKPPKDANSNRFYKMPGRPKSLVRILIPDGKDQQNDNYEGKRPESPQSVVSRAFSAVSHSTLSNLRYQLFGARSLKTPDYFRRDGVTQMPAGLAGLPGGTHLRQGIVRKPQGIQSLPVSISKMYKSVKWWTEYPGDSKVLIKADKQELGANFKHQMQQVWDWMDLWEDFEKIALLKELLKLCGPEDLNFLCGHLQQKLRNTRDINRMSDKLLLYIFSFVPADEIRRVKRVCRRWRYLCATDDLWMVKCHELGVQEGIKNLEKMIVKAKGYRMVIDWKLAYDELKKIAYNMKVKLQKKKPKQPSKGRTVEFKEQLELLQSRDEEDTNKILEINEVKKVTEPSKLEKPRPITSASSIDSFESIYSEPDLNMYDRPRFEFRNRISPSLEAPRGSISHDELQQIIKKLVLEPEEKEIQRAASRGTPVIVELEVHRGTVSAIQRNKKDKHHRHGRADDDDGHSVISEEDLQEYDEEYKLLWDKKPENKFLKSPYDVTRAVSTEGGVEILSKSEDRFDRIKRMQAGLTPQAGPSILRRKEKEKLMADAAGPDDAAFDIRPDLVPADDILGKAKSQMSLQWHQEKKPGTDDEDEEPDSSRRRRQPAFVGEVRSVLRARKLQGHMSGIMCVQFDNRRLISAGLDRVIRMWDIRSGRSLHKFLGHKGGIRCIFFYGNELATGSWDTTVMIWDLRNLCRRYILTDHSDSVTCVTMNQDYL